VIDCERNSSSPSLENKNAELAQANSAFCDSPELSRVTDAQFGVVNRAIDMFNCANTPATFVMLSHSELGPRGAQMLKGGLHMRLVGLHRLQPHSDNCYNDNETSSQCFHTSGVISHPLEVKPVCWLMNRRGRGNFLEWARCPTSRRNSSWVTLR
jgi:hypothetical protein